MHTYVWRGVILRLATILLVCLAGSLQRARKIFRVCGPEGTVSDLCCEITRAIYSLERACSCLNHGVRCALYGGRIRHRTMLTSPAAASSTPQAIATRQA